MTTVSNRHKEQPLIEAIRLLGRLLGDVIREQEGQATFDMVEKIRRLSVAYRVRLDAGAGEELGSLLQSISLPQTLQVLLSYFSHLINLAEDRHHARRRQHHERLGQVQTALLQASMESLQAHGVQPQQVADLLSCQCLRRTRQKCSVQPFLAAEHAIAHLLEERMLACTARARAGAQYCAAESAYYPVVADAHFAQ